MTYVNSTELMRLAGKPIYTNDLTDACLRARLNLFLQGDTGSGKTQLEAEAMSYFPDKSLFVLGRNDMDIRELFQQINLEKLKTAKSSAELKELTDKINYNLIVVDELPNCVPAVRSQLFNLFDGYIEINGKKYDIGKGYSVGIASGNIGQQFTESSNDLGRALKDRMHVIVDMDYFKPTAGDSSRILADSTNPRVEFGQAGDKSQEFIKSAEEIKARPLDWQKLLVANYLLHGLDYCEVGGRPTSKTKLSNALGPNWYTVFGTGSNSAGSDETLVLPVSMRAAKSVIRLSHALEDIAKSKGATKVSPIDSMLNAWKFVSAYSGVLNEHVVKQNANYNGDRYKVMDALIQGTRTQFEQQQQNIEAGMNMVADGELKESVLNKFSGRWGFMKDTLQSLLEQNPKNNGGAAP